QPAAPAEVSTIARTSYAVPAPGSSPQTGAAAVETPKLQLAPKYHEMVGHEGDYSWITGQLTHVQAEGGLWVVRYANVGEVDRFGGSVVLTPTVDMKNFREGDLVNVRGQILNNGVPVRSIGGALYRVSSILLVERAG